MNIRSRRTLQAILGFIWLLDGVLQLKPQMFTQAFINQVVLPTAQGQPSLIQHMITASAHFIAPHIAIYNLLFALIQLAIGLFLLLNRWVKPILIVSFVWAAIVWSLSEGFGMLFAGNATFLTGAPGAVFLYGLIGMIIWPTQETIKPDSLLSERRILIARISLFVLWMLGAVLQAQPLYWSQAGLQGLFTINAFNQLASSHPFFLNLVILILMAITGILLLFNHKKWQGIGFWLTILLALFIWWAGEGFGQMLTPLGTDPNSGPLLILLALCTQPNRFASRDQTRQA